MFSSLNSKKIAIFTVLVLVMVLFTFPVFGFAATDLKPPCSGDDCTFTHFIEFFNQILKFIVIISIPIATAGIAWSGGKILLSAGKPEELTDAKKMFTKILIGFMFILGAWLIVYTISSALVKPEFYNSDFGN